MIGLLVGVCGALGAVTRFLVDTWARRSWGTRFPMGTLVINVTGSLLLGAAIAAAAEDSTVALVIGVGFCGGYTTFSTAMVETVSLVRGRQFGVAIAHLLGQPLLCILAAAVGYVFGSH